MNSLHDLGPAADGHEVKRLHSAGPSCHEGQGPWGQHFWLCACKVSCPCYCNQDYNSPMGAIARGQDCYFFLAQVIQKSVEFVGFRNFYFPIPMVERWWLWPWLNFKERIPTGSPTRLERQEPEGAGPWVSALESSFLCPAVAQFGPGCKLGFLAHHTGNVSSRGPEHGSVPFGGHGLGDDWPRLGDEPQVHNRDLRLDMRNLDIGPDTGYQILVQVGGG